MAKLSVRGAVRDAVRQDAKLRAPITLLPDGSATVAASSSVVDSFANFAHKMGIGADNPLSTATYGFNPITRRHVLLEWIHRGSWIGGQAVDVIADDMTRQGIEYTTEMAPEDSERLDECCAEMQVWSRINETIKWGRLYGGCLGVILIDGQDMRTPLRADRIGRNAFRGILPLDRWMVEPATEDLVTELGPQLGMPRYYRVGSNAPALRGQAVHFSRCVFRIVGVRLPYQQSLTENLWGTSVLERLYDRMIAYDSASTGAAQLVYKAYLRTLKIKGLREVVSSGGPAMDGLAKYTDMMRRFQGIEGMTMIDAEDEFEAQTHGAFSGLSDIMGTFAEQLSGSLQIPLVRLFGQSPRGFGNGDNDLRNYYDHIRQRQQADLGDGLRTVYRCAALSLGLKLPDNFTLGFRSLWQLTETDKATIGKTNSDTVLAVRDAGIISDQVALQELRQASRITGVFTNITAELIDAAEAELPAKGEGMFDPQTGEQVAGPDGMPLPGGEPPAAGGE